jgi:hypothetical protein
MAPQTWSMQLSWGGALNEFNSGLRIGSDARIYLSGMTRSVDYPTTPNALETTLIGPESGVLTVLDPTATTLVYSSYLTGAPVNTMTVDAFGYAIVAGTSGENFTVTPGAFLTSRECGRYFLMKINPFASGSAGLVFASFHVAFPRDLATDSLGFIYITGNVQSSMFFPTTPDAFQKTYGGSVDDAYVFKVTSDGRTVVYSSYLGEKQNEAADGIAVDSWGNMYVTGYTNSKGFPITSNAFQTSLASAKVGDLFLTVLAADGKSLVYSTFFGGRSDEAGRDVVLGPGGRVYIAGYTSSNNLPTKNAFDTSHNGGYDAIVVVFDVTRSGADSLLFSTYVGGNDHDMIHHLGSALAVDPFGYGYVYLVGFTRSTDFPTSPGAFQTSLKAQGTNVHDAFVVKLAPQLPE